MSTLKSTPRQNEMRRIRVSVLEVSPICLKHCATAQVARNVNIDEKWRQSKAKNEARRLGKTLFTSEQAPLFIFLNTRHLNGVSKIFKGSEHFERSPDPWLTTLHLQLLTMVFEAFLKPILQSAENQDHMVYCLRFFHCYVMIWLFQFPYVAPEHSLRGCSCCNPHSLGHVEVAFAAPGKSMQKLQIHSVPYVPFFLSTQMRKQNSSRGNHLKPIILSSHAVPRFRCVLLGSSPPKLLLHSTISA